MRRLGFYRPKWMLAAVGLMAIGVGTFVIHETRYRGRAADQFVARCRSSFPQPVACQRLVDAHGLECWRLNYTPRSKANAREGFDPEGFYQCVIGPAAYKRKKAEAYRKRQAEKRRHFIP